MVPVWGAIIPTTWSGYVVTKPTFFVGFHQVFGNQLLFNDKAVIIPIGFTWGWCGNCEVVQCGAHGVELSIMVVKFPVFTQSMADAIAIAKQQAAAQGFKSMYLVKVDKVGNGAWEVTMRVGP